MRKQTRYASITPTVRKRVYERDEGRCVLCGAGGVLQCAHFIPRSQGGMGREKNLIMLCPDCHQQYDQSPDRKHLRQELRGYLSSKYTDWDESELRYWKDGG